MHAIWKRVFVFGFAPGTFSAPRKNGQARIGKVTAPNFKKARRLSVDNLGVTPTPDCLLKRTS
jgi:hypothetical protein